MFKRLEDFIIHVSKKYDNTKNKTVKDDIKMNMYNILKSMDRRYDYIFICYLSENNKIVKYAFTINNVTVDTYETGKIKEESTTNNMIIFKFDDETKHFWVDYDYETNNIINLYPYETTRSIMIRGTPLETTIKEEMRVLDSIKTGKDIIRAICIKNDTKKDIDDYGGKEYVKEFLKSL